MVGMVDVLVRNAGDDELARACRANAGAIGDAIAGRDGAVTERGPSIDRHRSAADGGLWNAVTRTAFPDDEADDAIRETIAWYGARTIRWWTGPADRPHDLEDRLAAHGFEGVRAPGMVCDLADPWDADDPDGLEIRAATSSEDVADFLTVLTVVYRDAGWQESWQDAFTAIGFADDAPVRVYVGRERGRPVSSSFLVLGAGVAGVYGVHTDPAERGRGLGAALTRAPMRQARDAGYEVAVLQAATKAASLYARIGFRTVCQIGIYEREPDGHPSE
jgi:ribosomal protein S18 acetylase RimI-like enzyme